MRKTYLVILIIIVLILEILIIKLILLVKLAIIPQGLAGKVVDRAGDDFFLELFTQLVIELQAAVELFELLGVKVGVLENLGCGRLGRGEEIEERVGVDGFADDAGAAGGCSLVSMVTWNAC